MSDAPTPRFDDPAFYLADPHETYRRLRVEDPLHWDEASQFWVSLRYDDIKHISSHPDLFSSVKIAILMDLINIRDGKPPKMEGSRGVMFMDPPDHGVHRKAISHRFTPKAVKEMADHVNAVIHDVIVGLPDGEFDWIEHVAEPVPVYVFAELMGIPRSEWDQVAGWATTIANVGAGQETDADMEVIFGEIGPYLWTLVEDRMANPTDDLLTVLTTATVDGEPLDQQTMVTWALVLLAAGSETTQSLIAGMADSLDRHPDQHDRLYAEPSLVGGAVEETLRWWTPVMSMARSATTDVELRGKTIEKDQGVLLLYSSANRDAERFGPTAEEFDITRADASNHLGFGFGEHFCMGAHLARREARAVLESLISTGRRLEVVGERQPRSSALVHTYDRLPVRLVDVS